ncbi:MAG: GGDEF domain-containing protein [Candidatus Omnitrophica bacterium]|nr:GGDEF domain-containing protein [Candidatus Omnitrophota bacterium]
MNYNEIFKIVEKKAEEHDTITLLIAIFAVAIIGVLDFITGYKLGFSIFYLLPICLVTWIISKRVGLIFAFYGIVVWVLSDILSRNLEFDTFVLVWNALIRLGFFLLFVVVLSELKLAFSREQKLSRTDHLTGISNNQHFFEILDQEIHKCRRFKRPLSIAYLDCDNFKQVNDTLGHQTGNALLKEIAMTIKEKLRVIDTVARLGGDEFIILLSESSNAAALETITRIKNQLLIKMKNNNWPVTFSIGMASFIVPPDSAEFAIKKADELCIKQNEKVRIEFIKK